jgi:hypothetical protein
MELELQSNAVLVMPFFWDAFDYEPAVQPELKPLYEGPACECKECAEYVPYHDISSRIERESRFDNWPEHD